MNPCPFCGSTPLCTDLVYLECDEEPAALIQCGCGARGPCETNEEKAVAAWNRRVSSEPKPFPQGDCNCPPEWTAQCKSRACPRHRTKNTRDWL